jgi:hypothetical protein
VVNDHSVYLWLKYKVLPSMKVSPTFSNVDMYIKAVVHLYDIQKASNAVTMANTMRPRDGILVKTLLDKLMRATSQTKKKNLADKGIGRLDGLFSLNIVL